MAPYYISPKSASKAKPETIFQVIRVGVGSVVINMMQYVSRKSLSWDTWLLHLSSLFRDAFALPILFYPLWTEDALITLSPTCSIGVGWVNQLYTTALKLQI